MSNYSLEIISHHPTFRNKSLRKYYVEGIDTVGAWGDEPFEIKFTNHTWQKVQVKISVDGTDVLTGQPATTEASKDMWVVNGYGTLSLKAWPETNNGGAAFVFTSANNSVAIHTHGDMSSRGIVAAAVFTEGHVEPIRYNPPIVIQNDHHHHHYSRRRGLGDYYPVWTGGSAGTYGSSGGTLSGTTGGTFSVQTNGNLSAGDCLSFNTCSNSVSADGAAAASNDLTKGLESLVAVGAGQHVDQKITYVAGLIKPTFGETVRVKYMWWDDLVSKLRQHNVPAPHASGFPGDQKKVNISLGSTPRIGEYGGKAFPREATPFQSYMRV
jgi:hypothetical protein